MKLIVKQTFDVDEVKLILCDPVIYEAIAGDGCPESKYFEPPMSEDFQYIAGYVNSEIIALMVYHNHHEGRKCHIQVLPEFRVKHAEIFTRKALEFRGSETLYAEIPMFFKSLINFAKKRGFEVIGEIDNNYIKSGVKYNTKILRFKDGIC